MRPTTLFFSSLSTWTRRARISSWTVVAALTLASGAQALGCSSGAGGRRSKASAGSAGQKFVGNITTSGEIRPDFLTYWNQITPENEGKWGSVEGERGVMNWKGLDRIYKFAKDNHIPFKQHTFVWGQQAPGWLDKLSKDEQATEIEEWIQKFCERYPDVPLIDVVNEPDHARPTFIDALGGTGTTGHDWVIRSFQLARKHCPKSKLILNDYNVLRWDTVRFISIANKVKAAGLLDAIGCQAHGLETQSIQELEANLNKVAALGVPIYISEYDINEADDDRQKRIMKQQFSLFYESPAVAGITLWGYVHGETWKDETGLLKDDKPRPAFAWLIDYLGR